MSKAQDVAIFVATGTDHHEFTRLLDWVDDWLEVHPAYRQRCVVQHGQSRPSRMGRNKAFMSYEDLLGTFGQADVVVVHGGPALIFDSRGQGRLPICVPRVAEYGEIVDDHQQRFTHYLANKGLILLCEDQEAFNAELDRLLADDPSKARIDEDKGRVQEVMKNLEQLVNEVTAGGRFRRHFLFADRPTSRGMAHGREGSQLLGEGLIGPD